MVAETLVEALTLLERITEGWVRTPAVIALNVAEPLSISVPVLLAWVTMATVAEFCGAAEFFSP